MHKDRRMTRFLEKGQRAAEIAMQAEPHEMTAVKCATDSHSPPYNSAVLPMPFRSAKSASSDGNGAVALYLPKTSSWC